MQISDSGQTRKAQFELRFCGMFNIGHGYVFTCDSDGHVDVDQLSERGRVNYFYVRALVGREFLAPIVRSVN